ncbi:ABC transporter ATP-binding protein [Rossellomorea vietnamensis]|jgi:oligopeptide transport system ATP-binding protein|uniref:ATP-binding cassette domain-containing protein n=1 Tax=Rossellomorea vietnamensis TaxID=218284 RepID=A0A6I6UMU1_9BACI|nr:ATP-binding cassette domain-containing protein [Rossellomorea vietnamensis]OXS54591.1 ABC transporter ATP-binding protein [Bacillus sp. DSM 27956]PRX65823.1 oligopeptide transport system ATP-binding protein [Bacillus sp. V-88]MCA0148956.1 ATP-binding cassette domain-containing protein [Rossellomorea vietnamensis]MCC5804503.1 ATP-binding cassette domain-containing protein [Rossellomorea vietnamensis]QHE60999.1 ATP-binding cassette domain-containing protein [Rossellomorea vietnamensis]
MTEKLLEIKNLKQYFNPGKPNMVKAVDDISFDIYKGETLGLVGESGCGKSTTGRTIIRLYDATDGQVLFNGEDVHGKKSRSQLKKFNRKMQMIFQDPYASLNPRMKVADIIAEGIDIHGLASSKEERLKKVHELLETVGLNKEHAGRYPHEFSGGQRQRIGIARALAVDPDFIIADEPISALDVSIQAQVVNLMQELQKEKGLTYLFIAHDLSMVKYISDRIGVMYYGKLVELTTSDALYKNPLHPYTQSLLSAIPLPDPEYERTRRRKEYNPSVHNYTEDDNLEMREVVPGHFVYCSEKEFAQYQASYKS